MRSLLASVVLLALAPACGDEGTVEGPGSVGRDGAVGDVFTLDAGSVDAGSPAWRSTGHQPAALIALEGMHLDDFALAGDQLWAVGVAQAEAVVVAGPIGAAPELSASQALAGVDTSADSDAGGGALAARPPRLAAALYVRASLATLVWRDDGNRLWLSDYDRRDGHLGDRDGSSVQGFGPAATTGAFVLMERGGECGSVTRRCISVVAPGEAPNRRHTWALPEQPPLGVSTTLSPLEMGEDGVRVTELSTDRYAVIDPVVDDGTSRPVVISLHAEDGEHLSRQWELELSSSHVHAMAASADGGLLLAGARVENGGALRGFVTRIGADGERAWEWLAEPGDGGSTVDALALDSAGNVFTASTEARGPDPLLIVRKLAPDGGPLWTYEHGEARADAVDVEVDGDDRAFVLARVLEGETRGLLLRFDPE